VTGQTLSQADHTSSTESLRVVVVDALDDRWDRFVAAASGSSFCHLAGWRQIMTDVLGHEAVYLAAVDGNETWRGVLPLVRVRSILGHYLVSLPFLNDGGPLGDDTARRQLVEHAVAEAQRSGAALLELRARTAVSGPVESSNRKISVHLEMPASVDELWAKTFRAKLRSQVRRPTKDGMTARCAAAELAPFYDVFARNMRDLGTPVLPRAFFERIAAVFGDRVVFATVYTAEGNPAAAACCLVWRDELEVTWASSLRELNRLSPNMLLYARLMEEAIGRGVRLFNFGRCTPDGPTHRFKQQWGGHDVPLPWAYWSKKGVVGTPSPDRPVFRVATAIWSRLPMAVANRLGPMLARQLP
jgi:FemAB-related protein (PEP-CTERM system-associated)